MFVECWTQVPAPPHRPLSTPAPTPTDTHPAGAWQVLGQGWVLQFLP